MATSTLGSGTLVLAGTTSGTTTVTATAVAGTTTLTLPAATDTLVGKATTDTLTNKTLTGAAMNGTLGATTPSTVAATTISASSTATFAAGAAGTPSITTTGDTNTGIFFPAADTIAFAEGGVEAARFDSSGNFGLGVTPSAWNGAKAFDIGSRGSLVDWTSAQQTDIWSNGYFNGSSSIYKTTANASIYRQLSGQHIWYNAPSGTAGNAITFTQAMTLDASGNLGVGTTSPSVFGVSSKNITVANSSGYSYLQLQGSSGNGGAIDFGDTSVRHAEIASLSGSVLAFYTNGSNSGNTITERARIDSSGSLLVGTTSTLISTARRLQVEGVVAAVFKGTGSGSECLNVWQNFSTGNNVFIEFDTDTSPTGRGTITYNRAAGLVAYNTTSDYRAKDIYGSIADSGTVIDSTPVYMGKMKGATQERPMFIAHETPTYAHTGEKDAVDADGKPVYQQMDTSSLVPVMWAEIQSLRKRLAVLESA